jgi:hypothetical protein
MNSCLRFQVWAAVSAPRGPSARGRRTVRKVVTSRLFVVFVASSCVDLFRSVELGVLGWSRFARLSARGYQTVRAGRTIRVVATDRPFFEVQYWLFGLQFRIVRRVPAVHLLAHRGLSSLSLRAVRLGLLRSPMSFAS